MYESVAVDEVELAEVFAGVARRLQGQDSLTDTWQAIADLAVEALGFEHCGISIVYVNGHITTPAASDELPVRVDALQYGAGQGPCLDAVREQRTFVTGDLSQESRWPEFAQRTVTDTGIYSMLSLWLFNVADTLGALNFYSKQADTFDDRTRAIAGVLAAHAAVAMSAAEDHGTVGELRSALVGSRVISAAVGILMVQTNSSRDAASRLLTQASQRSNVKPRIIAERIVMNQERHVARAAERRTTGGVSAQGRLCRRF